VNVVGGDGRTDVELSAGDQQLVVDLIGGGLRAYSARGRAILDGYAESGGATSGRGQVLIPWPNRLEDGRYDWDGATHQLPLTEPERRNAIHGLVRREAWSLVAHEDDRAVVEYRLERQPGYPFSLALRIEYTLSPDGLRVETWADNTGAESAPFGAGMHPYLAGRVDDVVLRAPGRVLLHTDERALPTSRAPVAGTEYDFTSPRRIGSTQLDTAFTDLERGADGLARVEFGDVAVWLDQSYGWLQLFTGDPLPDVARRSLAVEPMSCPPNAFRTGEDVVRLEPGDGWRGAWGIRP
jgi:aldose 1-epimerase